MNPFRKKSSPSPESKEGVEVEAPVAEPLDQRASSAFTDTEIPVDSWVAAHTSSSTSSSSPPPTKPTPRSPPPPVAPRRRRSQIAPKRYPVPEHPEPPTSSDPFNPNPEASSEPLPPSPPQHSRAPSISPANPFFQNQQAAGDARRSLDLTDPAPEPGPRPGRQSLDAEAFKRLMLTGQSSAPTIASESISTDTSSVSRQSIFEPILETDTAEIEAETPRTSHEIEDDEELQRALAPKAKDWSNNRLKPPPPPPKPRTRGGGGGSRSPISPPVSGSPPPRPASLYSLSQLDKCLPPPPPPPPPPPQSPTLVPSPPPSPAPSLHQKRIAPSPPLSRRHSVQSRSNPRLDPGKAEVKARPPPPPIRRMKSVSARPADYHRPHSLITTLPLPPPPPPPGWRNRSFVVDSPLDESPGIDSPSTVYPNNPEESAVQQDESDILFDLQKLQREVDELRGKYEGRGVGVSVSE